MSEIVPLWKQKAINSVGITPEMIAKAKLYFTHKNNPYYSQLLLKQLPYPWLAEVTFQDGRPFYGPKELITVNDKWSTIDAAYKDVINGGLRGKHATFGLLFRKYLGITFQDVSKYIDSQVVASQYNTRPVSINAQPMIANKPNDIWQIDTMNMGANAEDDENSRYIVNIVDVFSRKCWLFVTNSNTAAKVKQSVEQVIERNGVPKRIHTDNGVEFKAEFDSYLKSINVYHTLGPVYTPQAQGIVERCNQTVKEMIRRLIYVTGDTNWVDKIRVIQENINNSYHSFIKMTPNEAYRLRNAGDENYKSVKRRAVNHLKKYRDKKGLLSQEDLEEKFPKGTKVRISNKRELPRLFNKKSISNLEKINRGGNFSEQVYTVSKIENGKIQLEKREGERFRNTELKIVP